VNDWLKANGFALMQAALLLAVLGGQWQVRQDNAVAQVEELQARVRILETLASTERSRLDAIYSLRAVAENQNIEILRRLSVIEKKLDER
jgi:predicted negative regulator of RcsB-dependent stress response